jgi:hypothetical protein
LHRVSPVVDLKLSRAYRPPRFFLLAPQQLRQLGDVDGDAPGFVAGQQLACRAPPRFILAIDKGECLPIVIAHDEAGGRFPRRSKVAGSGACGRGDRFVASRLGSTGEFPQFSEQPKEAQSFLKRSAQNTFAAIGNPCAHSGTSISSRLNSSTLPAPIGISAPISSCVCNVST